MNFIKKYYKIGIIPIVVILFFPLICSIINLFYIKTNTIILSIIMSLVMLISGYLLGHKTNKKGYLAGLLLGVIVSIVLFIISLVYKPSYGLYNLVYYFILVISSTLGSMLGIQKNK